MKIVGICMSLWLVVLLFLPFTFFSSGDNPSMLVSGRMIVDGNTKRASSNLKDNIHDSYFKQGSSEGDVSLEDYRPFDPSPSSKASVRPGPIEHGTPLMPYIPNPKPSPPRSSDHDESP